VPLSWLCSSGIHGPPSARCVSHCHGLRRCFTALALAGGADISIVSKLLVHSSISITADIYAYMMKVIGQRAVNEPQP
jgi:integrase